MGRKAFVVSTKTGQYSPSHYPLIFVPKIPSQPTAD